MLVVQFTDSTDLDDAMTDLRDKVSQVKSQLPDDASDPTVMSIDIDSMPVVQSRCAALILRRSSPSQRTRSPRRSSVWTA